MRDAMMMSVVVLAFAVGASCGKKDEDKSQGPSKVKPTEPAPRPEPVARPAEPEPVAKAPTEPAEPALTKKKLSDMSGFDWMDILKAAGWTDASSGGMTMGPWKSSTIKAKKGDKTCEVTLVQPSGEEADPKATITAQSPKEQLEDRKQKGAAELLRDDVLLAVAIEGDPEGAKELLAEIKEWVIVE